MTSDELQQLRHARWQALTGCGLTSERLLEFVQEAGFCPFTAHPGLHLPAIDTLAGVPLGAADAPLRELTAGERSLHNARELLEYHIRHRQIVEVDLWRSFRLYIPCDLLGYLYVSVGDRKPEKDFRTQLNRSLLSSLAAEVYALLLEHQEMTRTELREKLGPDRTSPLAIDRAVGELALTLKVVRIGERNGDPLWGTVLHFFPEAPAMLQHVSKLEAAAALVSKLLNLVIVETEDAVAEFFTPIFPRSRAHSVLMGLEAGREVMVEHIDGRPAWRLVHTADLPETPTKE